MRATRWAEAVCSVAHDMINIRRLFNRVLFQDSPHQRMSRTQVWYHVKALVLWKTTILSWEANWAALPSQLARHSSWHLVLKCNCATGYGYYRHRNDCLWKPLCRTETTCLGSFGDAVIVQHAFCIFQKMFLMKPAFAVKVFTVQDSHFTVPGPEKSSSLLWPSHTHKQWHTHIPTQAHVPHGDLIDAFCYMKAVCDGQPAGGWVNVLPLAFCPSLSAVSHFLQCW